MELKNLSKKELMEMIATLEAEKNKAKKPKFDNKAIITACFSELLNIVGGCFIKLKNELQLLNSIGDKWNYAAYLLKAIKYIKDNNIDINSLKIDYSKAPADIFKKTKAIFNDIMETEKNIKIPKAPPCEKNDSAAAA